MTTKQAGIHGLRTATLALCAFAISVIPATAQDNSAPPPPQGQQGMGPGGRRDPGQMQERQMEMMTRRLNLSPEQVTQVKAIDDAQRTQMMALRDDTSTPQEEKRGKMMAIREDTQAKTRAVLTDDQKPKYDAMLAEQKQRMENRQGRPGGGPPPQV